MDESIFEKSEKYEDDFDESMADQTDSISMRKRSRIEIQEKRQRKNAKLDNPETQAGAEPFVRTRLVTK